MKVNFDFQGKLDYSEKYIELFAECLKLVSKILPPHRRPAELDVVITDKIISGGKLCDGLYTDGLIPCIQIIEKKSKAYTAYVMLHELYHMQQFWIEDISPRLKYGNDYIERDACRYAAATWPLVLTYEELQEVE